MLMIRSMIRKSVIRKRVVRQNLSNSLRGRFNKGLRILVLLALVTMALVQALRIILRH